MSWQSPSPAASDQSHDDSAHAEAATAEPDVEVVDESGALDDIDNSGEDAVDDGVDSLDDDEQVAEPPARPDRPGTTGDPRVDDAIARLDDLDGSPTSEHVEIVDDVHRRLQSALSDLDPSASD